jgi:hypothetical protein
MEKRADQIEIGDTVVQYSSEFLVEATTSRNGITELTSGVFSLRFKDETLVDVKP